MTRTDIPLRAGPYSHVIVWDDGRRMVSIEWPGGAITLHLSEAEATALTTALLAQPTEMPT